MPTLFEDLVALYEDQDEIHAGEGDTDEQQAAPSGDAMSDEEFQQHFQEILQLGPESPEFQESLAKLLEANPDKASQLMEEIGQAHPELIQQLEQEQGAQGGKGEQAPAEPQQPQPGEQNACLSPTNGFMPSSKVQSRPPHSAHGKVQYSTPGRAMRTAGRAAKEVASVASPAYGIYRAGRRIAGYQVRAEDEQLGKVQYSQDFLFENFQDADARAERNATHIQDLFPECVVYLDEMMAQGEPEQYDQGPPPGFQEWMENFTHAMKTNPKFAAMLGHTEGPEPLGTPEEPPMPEPGEQNALGIKTGLGAGVGGTLGLIGGTMLGHPFKGAVAGTAVGAAAGSRGALDSPDQITDNRGGPSTTKQTFKKPPEEE